MKRRDSFMTVLAAMEKQDLKEFEMLLDSGFFRLRTLVRKLFQLMVAELPTQPSDKELWASVYPNRDFNPGSLRKMYSQLYAVLQQYLAMRELKNSREWTEFFSFQNTNEEIRRVFMDQWKHSMTNVGVRNNSRQNIPESTYQALIAHDLYLHHYAHDIRERMDSPYLKASCDALDKFYVLKRIKLLCEIRVNNLLFVQQIKLEFEQETVDLAGAFAARNSNLIRLFLKAYQLLEEVSENPPGGADFEERARDFISDIREHHQNLDLDETRELVNYLHNACTIWWRKSTTGDPQLLEEVFLLRIATQTLINQGIILPEDFKNRISFLLIQDDIEAARNYYEEYRKFLPPQHDDSDYFSLACIQFHEGNFKGMRESFGHLRLSDPFHILDLKSLSIKAYFLEDEPVALESGLDALKKYLNRNKRFQPQRMKSHRQRLKLFYRCFRLVYGTRQSPKQLVQLKAEVQRLGLLSDVRFWEAMFLRIEKLLDK